LLAQDRSDVVVFDKAKLDKHRSETAPMFALVLERSLELLS
jgi:hypothetical protein